MELQHVTRWLDHSLVLASDYRVPKPERVWPLLERQQAGLADLGAHHVLVYTSTTDPGRVMVLMAIHAKETVMEVLRSRIFFDWFDAVGVDDIPAVFAGELIERLELVGAPVRSAPQVVVSVVTTVDDVTNLITHVRETAQDLRSAGVRRRCAMPNSASSSSSSCLPSTERSVVWASWVMAMM